jgi:hypothetical protein
VLLGIEELSLSDKGEAYERMKTWISNETSEFTRKHKDPETLPTPKGILVLSNSKQPIRLPADDRRFFVIQGPEAKHPEGPAYYERLLDRSPEFASAVYHALLAVDLTGFNPGVAPAMTRAKEKIIESSRTELSKVLEELIESEASPFNRDMVTLYDMEAAIKNRNSDLRFPRSALERAFEETGVEKDPKARRPRIDGQGRTRLFFLRNAADYEHYSESELASEYERQRSEPLSNGRKAKALDWTDR